MIIFQYIMIQFRFSNREGFAVVPISFRCPSFFDVAIELMIGEGSVTSRYDTFDRVLLRQIILLLPVLLVHPSIYHDRVPILFLLCCHRMGSALLFWLLLLLIRLRFILSIMDPLHDVDVITLFLYPMQVHPSIYHAQVPVHSFRLIPPFFDSGGFYTFERRSR